MRLNLKRVLATLLLLISCFVGHAQMAITNATVLLNHWDSQAISTYGQRQTFVLYSDIVFMHPTNVISCRDDSRSGGSNWEDLTNRLQASSMPHWYMTRGNTNIWDFFYKSSNTGESSNMSYTNFQDYVKSPTLTYNIVGLLTNDLPVAVNTNRIFKFLFSEAGSESSDGGPLIALANLGVFQVSKESTITYIDDWSNSVAMFTNIWQTNQLGDWGLFPAGHYGNEIQFALAMTRIHALHEDTNAFTLVVDANTLTPYTNHCTVGTVTSSGGTLTIPLFHADRMGPAYYHPTATQTNDMRGGFYLIPGVSNYCCEIIRITNCPAGTFNVSMDGVFIGVFSNTRLEGGINLFTDDLTSPLRQQKDKGLDLLCAMAHVNSTNASDQLPFNLLWTEYGSVQSSRWPVNTGMSNYAPLMQDEEALLIAQDQLINANAQQTNHTITITATAPYTPAPYR